MATGAEMLLKTLMPGFDPKEIFETVQGLGKLAVDLKQQLDRIEAQMIAIRNDQATLLNMAKQYPGDTVIDLPNPLETKGTN